MAEHEPRIFFGPCRALCSSQDRRVLVKTVCAAGVEGMADVRVWLSPSVSEGERKRTLPFVIFLFWKIFCAVTVKSALLRTSLTNSRVDTVLWLHVRRLQKGRGDGVTNVSSCPPILYEISLLGKSQRLAGEGSVL